MIVTSEPSKPTTVPLRHTNCRNCAAPPPVAGGPCSYCGTPSDSYSYHETFKLAPVFMSQPATDLLSTPTLGQVTTV